MRHNLFLLLISLMTACAKHSSLESLLQHELSPDKPFCDEVSPIGASRLAEALSPFREQLDSDKTGVYSLESGGEALVNRAWLTDNAAKSIDAQYFIFGADNVGMIATERLLLAAERGVAVRLLVDDLLAHGDAELLWAVSQHPNVSIRIYNPNLNIGKSFGSKIQAVLTDFRGINQRMHNKTFIVDQRVSITGGRNVGDEYFDFDHVYNFRDRDLLLFGNGVSLIQNSFDEFWSSDYSIDINQVMAPPKGLDPQDVWKTMHQYSCDPGRFFPSFRQRIAQAPTNWLEAHRQKMIHWIDKISYVSDKPGKNNETTSLGGGGKSTETLIALVKSAKESIVMQTPYLIVTELGHGLLADAVKRGVSVRILTNSLLSTDGYAAFAGYQRVRKDLLKAGVELYEFKPDAAVRRTLLTGPPRLYADYGLHAKTFTVDGKTLMVGTFNLDPRSANLNTEGVVIIEHSPLARGIEQQMLLEMQPDNAWRATLDENPDRHADYWRRFQVLLQAIVPKSIL